MHYIYTKVTVINPCGIGVLILILTRRVDETLIIGGNIQITLMGVKGSQASIGIDAPKSINIVREELLSPKLI